jgi:hypothetical protein
VIRFQGKHLFVNADVADGELRAEVLNELGEVVSPFSRDNCRPIRQDATHMQVRWEQGNDLSALAGEPVRLRFHLRNGSLYAFWVSPERNGASGGYIAAGGPGFTGPIDTVGRAP